MVAPLTPNLRAIAVDTDRLIAAAESHRHAEAVLFSAPTELLVELAEVAEAEGLIHLGDLIASELGFRASE